MDLKFCRSGKSPVPRRLLPVLLQAKHALRKRDHTKVEIEEKPALTEATRAQTQRDPLPGCAQCHDGEGPRGRARQGAPREGSLGERAILEADRQREAKDIEHRERTEREREGRERESMARVDTADEERHRSNSDRRDSGAPAPVVKADDEAVSKQVVGPIPEPDDLDRLSLFAKPVVKGATGAGVVKSMPLKPSVERARERCGETRGVVDVHERGIGRVCARQQDSDKGTRTRLCEGNDRVGGGMDDVEGDWGLARLFTCQHDGSRGYIHWDHWGLVELFEGEEAAVEGGGMTELGNVNVDVCGADAGGSRGGGFVGTVFEYVQKLWRQVRVSVARVGAAFSRLVCTVF